MSNFSLFFSFISDMTKPDCVNGFGLNDRRDDQLQFFCVPSGKFPIRRRGSVVFPCHLTFDCRLSSWRLAFGREKHQCEWQYSVLCDPTPGLSTRA